MSDPRRRLPRTDVTLARPELAEPQRRLGRAVVKAAVVAAQQRARAGDIAPEEVTEHAVAALPRCAASLRRVLNATGIVVHTNLGRAPLSAAALEAINVAGGSTDVEFDLSTGARARRGAGALGALADAVPDAGAAQVVNNNAAAVLLCALALAPGQEIVISRGELVEIGDGFRIPELLASAGARLREVGTTNRTHVSDYAEALTPETGFILKVHPSNFQITGFTAAADVAELVRLGAPVVVDIGSGLLHPHPGLPHEPDATSMLRAGADLVTASGDKLLGGPQAGLVLGRSELVARLRGHPAARAMRVDKLTLAALEATLRGPQPPVAQAMEVAASSLSARAETVARSLVAAGIDAHAREAVAAIGGGGAPGVPLPSVAISLPVEYCASLRAAEPPVIGRLERDRCLLDLRTVPPADDDVLAAAVRQAHSSR